MVEQILDAAEYLFSLDGLYGVPLKERMARFMAAGMREICVAK